jgi:flagellar motor switch/type III secretory pathway protein FliN
MSARAPGNVHPWLLLGERRRHALEFRVRLAAERWAAHWVAGAITLSVRIEPAKCNRTLLDEVPGSVSFGGQDDAGRWAVLLTAPRHLVAWAAGLQMAEFPAEDADDLTSGEIGLELVRGFSAVLIPESGALQCLDAESAHAASSTLLKHGVRVTCVFGPAPGLSLQTTLSSSTVATLLAERRVNSMGESLTSRRGALTVTTVPLDCCLGSVQVPVRDLHALRIGDVLVTDIALDGRAELRVRSKPRLIAAGRLGAVEGRKAIKVETGSQR